MTSRPTSWVPPLIMLWFVLLSLSAFKLVLFMLISLFLQASFARAHDTLSLSNPSSFYIPIQPVALPSGSLLFASFMLQRPFGQLAAPVPSSALWVIPVRWSHLPWPRGSGVSMISIAWLPSWFQVGPKSQLSPRLLEWLTVARHSSCLGRGWCSQRFFLLFR